jgi:LemA protein
MATAPTLALPRRWSALLLVPVFLLLASCGINTIPTLEERANAAWSEVLNQYQRRADLVPNLVETVKGYATHEREVLEAVTEARSRVGQMQLPPDVTENPELFRQFQENQQALTGALSRLIAVAEAYPDLKANQNFLALQSQLEGTENRIAVARKRYIDAVQAYNVTVRSFPTNLTAKMFGHTPKQNFTVQDEATISKPPSVDFNTPAQPPEPQPEKPG